MPVARFCQLTELGVVAATGADARNFLQGQLTCDLNALERHPGQLAAACNPQGRVLELMRLAAIPDGVLLVLRRALIPALLARLPRYVLRARLRLADRSDELQVAGLIDSEEPGAAELSLFVASPRRRLLVGPGSALRAALAGTPETTVTDWEWASIVEGEPDLWPGTAGLWIPHMLNLDELGAVSFTKGCYTGQEIVARTQHRGRVKRRMLRYRGPPGTPLVPGQELCGEAEPAAQVVRSATREDGTQILAVVGLESGGQPLGLAAGGREFQPAGHTGP